MEIKIGRKVTGAMDIIVHNNMKISREHAIISFVDGKVFVKDLNSANGTFVNGRRVSKKEIQNGDILLLGSKSKEEAYFVDVNKIKDDFKKLELSNKTNFKKEFSELKKVFENFQREKNQIKSKIQFKSQLPRIIASVSLGIIFIIFSKELPSEIRLLISPTIMILGFIPIGRKKDISDFLIETELKYQDLYVCPKCKKKYNLNIHWKKLRANKTCPHKCGAIFSD